MKKRPGPGPGDITSQLGSFLRSTWKQLDPVKDFVVQKSREGRRELDLALLRRKRRQALADLGEVALKLIEAGKLDEAEFPELGGPLSRLSELEGELGSEPAPPPRAEQDEEDFLDDEEEEAGKK